MRQKHYQLCGIGNAIIDILLEVSEDEFGELSLERGTMRLVSPDEQRGLLGAIAERERRLASGGSVANSIIAFAQLGGRGAFLGKVGDDIHGRFYIDEMRGLGIHFPGEGDPSSDTGTCLAIITPDAERTMRTCLGAAGELVPEFLSEEVIAHSEWLFIEGYLLANPEFGVPSVHHAIRIAHEHGTKVAITLSESWVVSSCREPLDEVLKVAELVFANEHEACALAGVDDVAQAQRILAERFPHVVVTMGPKGAFCKTPEESAHVPAIACDPKDLTGAGDMVAGSYLYGLLHGLNAEEAGKAACYMASQVIRQVGPRLFSDVRDHWEGALRGARGA